MPVKGNPFPEQELFGVAACSGGQALALSCGQNEGPGTDGNSCRAVLAKKTGRSRTISRVLFAPGRAIAIPLEEQLPALSSSLPGRYGRASLLPYLALLQTGYAEHAVSPRHLVVSYSTVSPLPGRYGTGRAVCFLWRCPKVALPGRYPASCPVEPGLSSPGQCPQRRSVRLLPVDF